MHSSSKFACLDDATPDLNEVCSEVRSSIVSAVRCVLDLYDHTKGMEIRQGFYCPCRKVTVPHFSYCPSVSKKGRKATEKMKCTKSRKGTRLSRNNQCGLSRYKNSKTLY